MKTGGQRAGAREGRPRLALPREVGRNTQLKSCTPCCPHPGTRHEDLGPDYYERQRDTRLRVSRLSGALAAHGYQVTLCRLPEPEPAQAA